MLYQMSEIIITIRATSEHDEYEHSLHETMKGILDGNRMGRWENDADSYEFSVTQIHN